MKHLMKTFFRPNPVSGGSFMMRSVRYGWLAALLVGFQSAFGYSFLGPINEPYQVVTIGYNLSPVDQNFIWLSGGADIGAPKDFDQGYRRNTPVMYYAMDANWLTYFGSNGVAAVDQAYAILNALPPVSQMSASLSEYPLEAQRVNSTAQALFLYDVKSATLGLMVEQLGLAQPERYVWALHDRYLPSGGHCPADELYLVVKRNFDPVTMMPSSYVNGTLYSYIIDELCDATPPPNWRAICEPVPVDPDATPFSSVASQLLPIGTIYTGLTRDDVGGLRALLRTNNMAVEYAPSNSVTIVTNTLQATELFTSNLTEFAHVASISNATVLASMYPGLVITSSTNYPVYQWVTNLTFLYYTNRPFDPAGTVPYIPVYLTNRMLNVQIRYKHTFANLVTFNKTASGWATVPITSLDAYNGHAFVTLQTIKASLSPWDPTGSSLVTNVSSRTFFTNDVVGDFVILPTNSCGFQVAFPLLTNVYTVTFTNSLTGTNALAGTVNPGTNGVSGSTNQAFVTQTLIEYMTNRVFWAYNVDCQTNGLALRQGIEKITFIRRDFDSLLNRFFYPVTNSYTLISVTNNLFTPLVVQRVVTTPDFLFTAQDLNGGPGGVPATPVAGRGIVFNQSPAYSGQGGPGTIEPFTGFVFNKAAPVFYNRGGNTASEATQETALIWGSFGMDTNPPVVYPSGTSLENLENMVLISVTPPYLPDGVVGTAYSAQLQTQAATPNWVAPYTWTLTPSSPALPPGLSFSSDGLISGTPTTAGSYNFVVRVTDAQSRTLDRSYAIQVN
jgi:hypothetical protein